MLPGFMKIFKHSHNMLGESLLFREAVIRIMKWFHTQELDSSVLMKKHKEITHDCQGWEARAPKLKTKVYK